MASTVFQNGTLIEAEWMNSVNAATYTPVYNVKDPIYGAKGDGTTDDYAAILKAVTAANVAGRGTIYFPPGDYVIASGTGFTLADKVNIVGAGQRTTKILKAYNGDLFPAIGGYTMFANLSIDMQGATYTTGSGVVIPANKPGQVFINVEIRNAPVNCLLFAADGGSGFKSIACQYYTLGTVGTVGAVKINGTDTAANPRHFYATDSAGCTLFDFGGANDTFVSGGYTNGLIFGTTSAKVMMTNMRIGAAAGTVTIKGGSHKIKGCVFASPVILDSSTTSVELDSEVPSWDITDSGTTNYITMGGIKSFTPTWTSSGTQPTLGNGTLTGVYSRRGNEISCEVNLQIGSTTTQGTGTWYFALPRADYSFITQVGVGSCYAANNAATSALVGVVQVVPGGSKVQINCVTSGGAGANVGTTTPFVFDTGSIVRMKFTYITT